MVVRTRSEHRWHAERLSYFELAPDGDDAGRACAVIMHGGGSGDSKESSVGLADDLAARGCRVLGIDFPGSGHSGGNWSELTLDGRREAAASLIATRTPPSSRLTLIGFSMSGQTAADLVGVFGERVDRLCLCAPGVYPLRLRGVAFGDESFRTLAFDTPDLWSTSPALAVFSSFPGRILLVLPERDETVPPGMTTLIEHSVRANPRSDVLTIPGAGHLLDHWFADHPADRRSLVEALSPAATGPATGES